MSDIARGYGEALSAWITATGQRVAVVAATLGVTPQGVWSWRNGRTLPSTEMQERIAELTDGAVPPVAEVYREALEARR